MEGKLIKFSSKEERMWTAKLDDRDMDFSALSYDNTSKVIIKLWDALDVIVQKLNKEE